VSIQQRSTDSDFLCDRQTTRDVRWLVAALDFKLVALDDPEFACRVVILSFADTCATIESVAMRISVNNAVFLVGLATKLQAGASDCGCASLQAEAIRALEFATSDVATAVHILPWHRAADLCQVQSGALEREATKAGLCRAHEIDKNLGGG